MRWNIVLGLARAEARLTRRLVRYWVFVAAVLFAGLVWPGYLATAVVHGLFSSLSGTAGSINPRFLLAGVGLPFVVVFAVGLVFLAFDVRARDERERIAEVLDSRPCTNLELVSGRFLGILFHAWWPAALTVTLIQILGGLAEALNWPIGELVEPWSILAFLVTITIPAFSFVLALVFLASFLLRNRLATSLVMLAALGVWIVPFMRLVPIDMVLPLDLTGAYTVEFGSDMVPVFTGVGLLQRAAVLTAALGLLALAAAVHPRPDGRQRGTWALGGVALLVLAIGGEALVFRQVLGDRAQREQWKAAHEARRGEAAPDLDAVRGAVTVEPGHQLGLELEIDFKAPPEAPLEQALFTLNPGLEVERLTDGSGRAVEFTHVNGLLEVELGRPLAAGEASSLALAAGGAPDPGFAYLDAYTNVTDLTLWNGALAILGYMPAIWSPEFVGLMPAIRWLPAAGADVRRGDPGRGTDFFHLDLEVEVPEAWLVAGPGRRRQAEGPAPAGRARFRFAPEAPLPEAGLFASRYVRRAVEVAGVEVELLLHPGHTRNLEIFEEAAGEIRAWLADRFEEAAELGLPYPYEALTLVEVPNVLKGYGGGWRMDSVMAPPAVLLMKESGFPTARFSFRFRNPKDFESREGGIARAKREVLESFFENDFNGGNIFLGAARNFFLYQTAAHGGGARALDFVCHDMTNRLVTGKQGYFSAHVFADRSDMNDVMGNAFMNLAASGGSFNDALRRYVAERPEIWDRALGVSLAEMDPWDDPSRAVDVLVLKGGAMAHSLLDGLGRRRAGELLAALRERKAGTTFDRDDLLAAASELGIDLGGLVGDWLDETELPGFVASEPRLFRLPDADDGTPRYQVALHLRNDEPAPGLLRLRYSVDGEDGDGGGNADRRNWQESDPVKVGAEETVEIGMVLSKPPSALRVSPYLALNRDEFTVSLPALEETKIVEAEPFAGVRESDWNRADDGAIVVDDLDAGFGVESDQQRQGLRLGARARDQALDQGLPVAVPLQVPGAWSRLESSEAWGKYRHTLAVVRKGTGQRRAVFAAELPRSGPWQLELHLVPSRALRWKRGTYHLTVEDASGSHELTFDAGAAEEGWNALGELELAAGEVRLEISDETDGRVVTADAIRWRPAGPIELEEETDG